MSARFWTLAATVVIAVGAALAFLARRRRDELIIRLVGQLADARSREAALIERLTWYQATTGTPVLHLVQAEGQSRVAPARRISK